MYGERASKGKLYNKICMYVAGMYSIAFMTGVRGMRENLGGGCRGCGLPPLKMTYSFFNTTGILQNMEICMICILKSPHYVIA